MNKQKLAFFIENPHHFDFYKNIFSCLNKDKFYIILNDKYKSKSIFKESLNFIGKQNFNYFFLSENKNFYFDHIISTLESKICFFYLFKRKIFFHKNNKLIVKILSRLKFNFYLIEKSLSKNIIFFPRGMDIKKKNFINPLIKEISNIYFCHSEIDKEIIKNENIKEIYIIGYPRYDNFKTQRDHLKKNILFLPSVANQNRTIPNKQIENFLNNFKNQLSKYNFFLKPHPMYSLNKKIMSIVHNHDIKILSQDVNLGSYYDLADYVICNNTGPFFSSIFIEKQTIILNEIKDNFHPLINKIYNKYKNYYYAGEEKTHLLFKEDGFSKNFWIEQKKIRKKFKNELFKNSPENGSKVCCKYLNEIILDK